MANVGALKQFLEQFDDDTQVEVVAHDMDDGRAYEINLELDEAGEWQYTDFKGVVSEDHPLFNRKVLTLGRLD